MGVETDTPRWLVWRDRSLGVNKETYLRLTLPRGLDGLEGLYDVVILRSDNEAARPRE